MCWDDKFDEWIDHLCTCAVLRHTCEWHRRLRGRYDTRQELGEEMNEIMMVNYAIYREEMEVPEGWVKIRGNDSSYWAPADRGY